jgi:hypothetical protein
MGKNPCPRLEVIMREAHEYTLFLARNFSELDLREYSWSELFDLALALDLYNRFEALRRELKKSEKTAEMRSLVGYLGKIEREAKLQRTVLPDRQVVAIQDDPSFGAVH